MPRFGDRWVVDRTLFEYVNGGSCACCGFNHFLPGGTKDLIQAMSDLETDAANAEVSALETSPWPQNMRDQVWSDRLKLRTLMKREMSHYSQFWKDNGAAFQEWCLQQDATTLKKLFQMPRLEISDLVKTRYNIHSAFAVVLCTVVEQVANFKMTQLPMDGRGDAEIAFETILGYDRRGGFTIPIKTKAPDGNFVVNTDMLHIWFDRMQSLGGPKLLDRAAPKKKKVVSSDSEDDDNDDEEEGDADDGLKKRADAEEDVDEPAAGPSFRSDRRIIRLLIARYWADQMMKKFLAFKEQQKREKASKQSTTDAATEEILEANTDKANDATKE